MSTTTWTQYVAMEDTACEPGNFVAAIASLEDWDEDFEPGVEFAGDPFDAFEDPE